MVYRGAQVWNTPFCRAETQNAPAKSWGLGTWSAGSAGPKSPYSGVRAVGERRMLGVEVEAEEGLTRGGIGAFRAMWVIFREVLRWW